MYKCLECKVAFDFPVYKNTGSRWMTKNCPICDYDKIEEQCNVCGEYHPWEDLLSEGICERCANKAKNYYTTGRGMEFLEAFDLEEEFYIKYGADFSSHGCDTWLLIDALKPNKYGISPITDFEKKLKEFCLYYENLSQWIEFYSKETKLRNRTA